nr:iron ABC transporter permease [uncultured Desulfobulbus sp.]
MSDGGGFVYREYSVKSKLRWSLLALALLLLLSAIVVGLAVGASGIHLNEIIAALLGEGDDRSQAIIWQLRLPRVLMAVLVGCGLGLSGTVFQAVLRNPLASPYTLGIGSAAGFGAVSSMLFFAGHLHSWRIAMGAFVCALFSAVFILAVARMRRASSETMILTGIAQMFLFSALTSLMQYMGTKEQVYEIVFWFFGSLSKVGWPEIGFAAIMVFLPMPFLFWRAWDFNLLALGDESALSLGVPVESLRMWGVMAASLITAGSICFIGVIGFVGLVAPHITRMVMGNDHQFLLPASGMTGALLVVVADTIGRTLWSPQVVPIGIVTAFIGVPFFFYLLLKRSKEFW